MNTKTLYENLAAGDRFALSKAITLVESSQLRHRKQAAALMSHYRPQDFGQSIRIGISGAPGVGKSTFIEALGQYLAGLKKKIAVLSIDPSSTQHGGSILGDKTRMEQLSISDQAYIRPSPSLGNLGGISPKTYEAIQLCEMAGYDIIIIETVGVGQSEIDVMNMTDLFALLILPGSGDELQGIKRGIMEQSDLIIINKADGDQKDLADSSVQDYKNAMHLFRPKKNGLTPKVLSVSSIESRGIDEVWNFVNRSYEKINQSGWLSSQRKQQSKDRLESLIKLEAAKLLLSNRVLADELTDLQEKIATEQLIPLEAYEKFKEKVLTLLSNKHIK